MNKVKGKLSEIGLKKLIIMAIAIILVVISVIVVMVTLSKDNNKAAGKENLIETVEEEAVLKEKEQEEASTEMDNDTPAETATEIDSATSETTETSKAVVTDGKIENESSAKRQSFYEEFNKLYTVHTTGTHTSTDLKCLEIYANNDTDIDYWFRCSSCYEYYYLIVSTEDGYRLCDDLDIGAHYVEYYYVEKTGTIIRYVGGYYGEGGYDVYQLNATGEVVYQYCLDQECILDSNSNPLLDENGVLQLKYYYSGNNERFELTAEEYAKKLDELANKWTSLEDVTLYKDLKEFSWFNDK